MESTPLSDALTLAHETAEARLDQTITGLTGGPPLTHEPVVTSEASTPWQVQEALHHIGVFVSLQDLAARAWAERLEAMIWAREIAFSEGGNGTPPDERPQWLPGRDRDAAERAIVEDWTASGGIVDAKRIYGDEWQEPTPEFLQEPAPRTFLDELEDIGDDDIIADLASVGVSLEFAEAENSNVEWQVFADRLLASAQATQATLEERREAERLQHYMITNRYAETNGVLERQLERTLALAERIAEHLQYPKKAKSIKLPHGQIGFKDFAEKYQVEDATKAGEWAEKHLPAAISTETVTLVNKSMIAAHAKETQRADIPGVKRIDERREFYASPLEVDQYTRTPIPPKEYKHKP